MSTPPSGTPPLLPIPLPTSSTPLLLPSTDRRADRTEVCLPPQKRLCIALGLRYEVGESSSTPTARPTRGFRADYGFVATLDDEIRRAPATDDTELGQRMTEFVTMVRQDTDEIYVRLTKAQDARAVLSENMTTKKEPLGSTTAKHPPPTSVTNASIKGINLQGCCRFDDLAARGVIELTQWFERMETVFCISNCSVENQIKFATCTLLRSALTWWNSHVKTIGHDVSHAMTWTNLKKKMTDKYCLRGEIKKLEVEMWNLKVKESNKIEKYVSGLPNIIYRSVMASKPKTMHDAIEFATELMDKKIRTFVKRKSENKRKQDDNQQQQQNKRQNTGRAYAARSGEKKPYGGSKPLCSKYNYHHDGQCAPKCHKCNRVGHLARDWTFQEGLSKAENNNRGNQGGNGNAPAKVYAIGYAGTNPDSNVITSTFLLNNRYASVLFDTGADRSFVSTTFSS
ncbi:putative reverse transcriptase domain-containing protein [Tanacetum coccineum]